MNWRILKRGEVVRLTLRTAGAGLLALFMAASARSATDPDAPPTPGRHWQDQLAVPAAPIEHRRVHYNGDVWMSVSNNGSIGTNSGAVTPDPRDMQTLRINYGPSFESPAGSRIDYLFNGSLWIGGIVGTDTLVSAQHTSESGDAHEWNGFTQITPGVLSGYPGECDTITRQLAQAYTAIYSDTLILPNTQDPRGRQHLPMGLEVVQTSHQSNDNFTRRFIIYDYKVTNISNRPIEKMWFGLFLDNDVFWENVSGCQEPRTSDDLSGILTTWPNPVNPLYTDSIMVAWAMDDDGDVCGGTRFPRISARGCMGIKILRGPTPESRVNFNWFTAGFGGGVDWGPRKSSDTYEFGTGGSGLPPGDAATYHVMSNGEIDYSQPFAAIDFRPEWQRPAGGSAADNVANGLDTRICISAGPMPVLNPGETVPFTVAYIASQNVHRDPLNRLDPRNPQVFMDKLDFSDLATSAWWAGFVWDNYGFDTNKDEYAGEYYEPVLRNDTVYYSGDGCPDLAGPAPPTGPDSSNSDLRLISRPGELIMRWSGRTIETSVDPLLRTADFEGYRVYVAERSSFRDPPGSDDYSLIATWDKLNFRRHTYQETSGLWILDSEPLSKEEWREFFSDPELDVEEHKGPSIATCYRYMDIDDSGFTVERCAYFAPQDYNRGNEYLAAGQIEKNLIQRVAVHDTIIDDVPFQYGEYELRLTGLLESRYYFLTLTAFDRGDPFNNLEPLETARGALGSRLAGIPVYSADVVEEYSGLGGAFADSVEVSVYPNPYKISFTDGSGRLTSYFEQGFEGTVGQAQLNEEDRRIHFINIPDECVINIYTLDGDLVRTLEHPDPVLSEYSSKISWDLISRNTQAVTSGIYLYRVDSKLGSQVGKIVIIK